MRKQLIILGFVALTGCAELELETWEPLDYEGLVDALENPEDPVEEDAPTVRDAFRELLGEVEVTRETVDILDPLLPGRAEQQVGPVAPRSVTGTNLFARISCPGRSASNPDTDFGSGKIRIESPGTLREAATNWQIREDFLLLHEDCRVGSVVLNGESPGFWNEAESIIALDVQVEVANDNGNATSLRIPSVFALDYYAGLFRLNGRTYSVRLELSDRGRIEIRGSDGAWQCSFEDFDDICERME